MILSRPEVFDVLLFMAHSARIENIKTRLRVRLAAGVARPGDRFLSARELAARFGISYQTAHILIGELRDEGLLERRAKSGTFVPGGKVFRDGAHLFFGARGQREGSFGAQLLAGISKRLERDGIPIQVSWIEENKAAPKVFPKVRRGYFPVLWEAAPVLAACLAAKKAALLLNERPAPGLSASFLDSVSIDDFSGGAGAAQLLLRELGGVGQDTIILGGPLDDPRSQARCGGFLSIVSGAPIVAAGSWFFEDGYRVAPQIWQKSPRGLFCVNDRLAESVIQWCRDNGKIAPPMVGFDDAPVAESLGLTTMAIPWDEFIFEAAELVKKRVNGDAGAARQVILTPRPVVRS